MSKERIANTWGKIANFLSLGPFEMAPTKQLAPYIIIMTVMVVLAKFVFGEECKVFYWLTVGFEILGLFASCMIIRDLFCTDLAHPIWEKAIHNGCELFLNGHQAWLYYDTEFFYRLGRYIGHGLCYEASALMMILLRHDFQTRLVFGRCYSSTENRMVLHAWVEVKHLGVWWVVDSTWINAAPVLKAVYYIGNAVIVDRKISNREFWTSQIAREFYQSIKKPETSYLFHNLIYFRRATKSDKGVYMMRECCWDDADGLGAYGARNMVFNMLDAFSSKVVVSQRIINEFLRDEHCMRPKAHTVRKAKKALRELRMAREKYYASQKAS